MVLRFTRERALVHFTPTPRELVSEVLVVTYRPCVLSADRKSNKRRLLFVTELDESSTVTLGGGEGNEGNEGEGKRVRVRARVRGDV